MEQDAVQMNLGVSRRDLIKRGAIVGGAIMWAAPVVETFARPAFAAGADGTPPPGEEPPGEEPPGEDFEGCFFTGGGHAGFEVDGAEVEIDTGGGFVIRCDVEPVTNITVQLANGDKLFVRSREHSVSVECDNLVIDEAPPCTGGFDTVIVRAEGEYVEADGDRLDAELFLRMTDRGEPSRREPVDEVDMTITTEEGEAFSFTGVILTGNFQAHCPGNDPNRRLICTPPHGSSNEHPHD